MLANITDFCKWNSNQYIPPDLDFLEVHSRHQNHSLELLSWSALELQPGALCRSTLPQMLRSLWPMFTIKMGIIRVWQDMNTQIHSSI